MVGQAALDDRSKGIPKYIPEIVGRHHGYIRINRYATDDPLFGGKIWQERREELVEILKTHFNTDWPKVQDKVQAALLSGLTCVSDWIASGLSLDGIKHLEDIGDLSIRINTALDKAGFVLPKMKKGLLFRDIFDGNNPRPVQSLFIETVSTPGIYVLEAPMGIGKTEAALYAAYNMYISGNATGIYFALPTRLTSNNIYIRFNNFLMKVLENDSRNIKAKLIHSSAWLAESEMGEEGEPGGAWFNSRKRRILAPFGVGTIDQALMAVMNIKHGFVRTFGLAGKVVILDEVHSYDSYTGTLLDKLIKWLKQLGCTVIILSATLTGERKQKILDNPPGKPNSAYPLISAIMNPNGELLQFPMVIPDNENKKITIRRILDVREAVEEALKRAKSGQQVLWIENTVPEAQRQYKYFCDKAKDFTDQVEIGLLHSRFIQQDRDDNEKKWIDLFGRAGKEQRQKQGRILVGTQVLEQSLDIDADFLVTRFCPIDMLLQRLGRLWRHDDTPHPANDWPEAWIIVPDYEQVIGVYERNPKTDFNEKLGPTSLVYDPYVLLRTLEILKNIHQVKIPDDISSLIEKTYMERTEQNAHLNRLKRELEAECEKFRRLANQSMSGVGKTKPDIDVEVRCPIGKTRYSDWETRDVLLLRQITPDPDGGVSLTLTDGSSLKLKPGLKYGNEEKRKEWRNIAAILNKQVVTVPEDKAPLPAGQKALELFKEYIYTGLNNGRETLRIALITEDDKLLGLDEAGVSKEYDLRYTSSIGYQWTSKSKINEEERNG